jgi:Protein of unknown function (DUF4240)
MNDTMFWKIIQRAKSEAGGDPGAVADCVYEQLVKLAAAEIESFDTIHHSKHSAAYAWRLWGAAYLMNGGCSDDGFEYFRCWLVAQGKKVYEAALADADSLAKVADLDNDDHECEEMLYVASRAYEEVVGKPLPSPPGGKHPSKPSGERWDFDDQDATAKQLPRLTRRYK